MAFGEEPGANGADGGGELSIEELEAEITTLSAHLSAATYRFLVLVGELERRKGWAGWGVKSCAHWLSWKCGIGIVAARDHVRVARALPELPLVSEAMAAGRLSYSKVRAITRIAGAHNESALLAIAENGTASHVERVVRYYRKTEPNREREQERARGQHARRGLLCFWDHDGCLVLEGRLPPEQGALLMKALEAADEALLAEEKEARAAEQERRRASAEAHARRELELSAEVEDGGWPQASGGELGDCAVAVAEGGDEADELARRVAQGRLGSLAKAAAWIEQIYGPAETQPWAGGFGDGTEKASYEVEAAAEEAAGGELGGASHAEVEASADASAEAPASVQNDSAEALASVQNDSAGAAAGVFDASAEDSLAFEDRRWRSRQADALCLLAETALGRGVAGLAAGERHLVQVHVDLDALRDVGNARDASDAGGAGGAGDVTDTQGGRCHIEGGVALARDVARRLSCDGGVVALFDDGAGQTLDVGRKTRAIPPATRRALDARDQGCRFPGCTCSTRFTDAHHIEHWADGGETKPDNLTLLCRFHHRLVHERGFTVERCGDELVFRRPDGREVPRAPKVAPPTVVGEEVLVQKHQALRLAIDARTSIPGWGGEVADYTYMLTMLEQREAPRE